MLFMPEGFIGIFDRWLSPGGHSAHHRESMATSETVP
jgi:hypothetical protein